MRILVTGAKGFVGKNLCASLRSLQQGYDRTHPGLTIEEVMEYDLDTDPALLDRYCSQADFVFNLAGVNRPKDPSEFMAGNFGFATKLLDTLKAHQNTCPVMLSSSIQACLSGRYADSEYGRSKRAGEELFFRYSRETGAPVYVFRFPNLFGKWCRPNYNSVTATFCYNIARGLPITISDPSTELELLYIDDLVAQMLLLLEGKGSGCHYEAGSTEPVPDEKGPYYYVPVTHHVTLGEMAGLLKQFSAQPETLMMPAIPEGSFAQKLYATYLSYLPKEKAAFDLTMKEDERGSFTEFLKTADHGQVSVNISRPGVTKGQHWHHSKWEFFLVVSGHGLIRERKIGTEEVMEFEVTGDHLKAVHMLPGYTHSIVNLSSTENLVTVMWASELFDPSHPDTFHENV